jgi:hypothetical protein
LEQEHDASARPLKAGLSSAHVTEPTLDPYAQRPHVIIITWNITLSPPPGGLFVIKPALDQVAAGAALRR